MWKHGAFNHMCMHLHQGCSHHLRGRVRPSSELGTRLPFQESAIPPNSLNSDKSPPKSSFSRKVYSYCLNFPLFNTASALCKSGIRKLILFLLPSSTPWCSIMHCTCLCAAGSANFAPEMVAEVTVFGQLVLQIYRGFH